MFMKVGLLQGLFDFLRTYLIAGMLNAETAMGQLRTINSSAYQHADDFLFGVTFFFTLRRSF